MLESVTDKLKYESEYIIKDLEKNVLELGGMTDLFLNSVEVTQLLNESETDLSVMVIESQLSKYIEGFRISFGEVRSFNILDDKKESIYHFNLNDPFATPVLSDNLNVYIDDVAKKIGKKGSVELATTSYELIYNDDGKSLLNIFRTFSPDIPITSNRFPGNVNAYTAVIESYLDVEQRYTELLKGNFDDNVKINFYPRGVVSNFDRDIHHEIKVDKKHIGTVSSDSFLSVTIEIPDEYFLSKMEPYRNTIISVVINISIITFILLKLLIQRQIIRPIVSLTEQVEEAINGGYNLLTKIERKDEVASLNNNYLELFDELNKMAKYDHLTGLTNRKFFNSSIETAINHAERYRTKSALLYIDIDNFKYVNDTFGHHIGDLLLKSFAKKLNQSLRSSELLILRNTDYEISRLAGDEFAVLLMGMPNTDAIAHIAKRVAGLCQNGFDLDGANYDVRLSIGISVCPDDADEAELLLVRADSAMYQVKKKGKNGFQFYSKALDEELKRHALIEEEIKLSLEQETFYLVYMPVFDCRNGRLVGAESLLRSSSELLSTCGPAEFIPIAESSELIRDIDYWVIESSIKKLKELIDKFRFDGTISVNFSAWELKNENFAHDLSLLIKKYSVPACQLELEITETHLIIDNVQHISVLNDIKSLGVHLALDDFGTGYTAFRQLMNYPVDTLKIDRSFIDVIDIDSCEERLLVDIIVELGELYHLNVVAEGVETQHHFDYVRKLGCDRAQGYFLSKPIEWEELVELYQKHTPKLDYVSQRSEHELIFKTTTGSVSVHTDRNLMVIDYRGLITYDLVEYVINSIDMCVPHLTEEKWGALVINDYVYDISDEVKKGINTLVTVCLEHGCIESAYVIKSDEAVKQIKGFRDRANLANNLSEKTFSSVRLAKEYLTEKLKES
ncbi:hypothetical protein DI392_10680 [Vibrio albus]|uniref:EAL domain-containing protein n=1 Tax=Vibrio albus TaxID=2200953 RepID=A0A2U3B954_9VIBR|nr:GGDEF domain-containing phosphodiesterase [Vibrio albus]PWI33313.1 hypothetical protein DI392_10680 [Vibrio albus]